MPHPPLRAWLALAAICLIWGTTYTGIKYCILDFPPFLLVGLRQSLGGLMLLALAFIRGQTAIPGKNYVWKQSLTGLVTILGGNGLITWGMQYVSSGLSAVIGSLTPVMVVLVNLVWTGSERVSSRTLAGVVLGFAGLGVLFSEGWADFLNPTYRLGIAAAFGSCFTWSLGTVMAKRFNDPGVSPIMNAGLQVTAGGLGGFICSWLFDTTHVVHHTWMGWTALLYLALVGSALAFTLYMYMLKHLSTVAASLYTYINPIVAVFLGWLLFGERLTAGMAVGVAITLGGIWLVNSNKFKLLKRRRFKKHPSDKQSPEKENSDL